MIIVRYRPAAIVAWLGLSALLQGCVTATVQEVREAHTTMNDRDSIVVLGRRNRPSTGETELNFISCIGDRVGNGRQAIPVMPERAFMDALFPWFEPRTAPVNARDLPEMIAQPTLARRLEEIGIKYVVWVEGSTRRTESSGSMSCTVSTAGGGCFGFLTWENDSSYEASIWDVRSGKQVGKVSSEAVGTSYMPAIVVPVPIIARVRPQACASLASQLKSFLNNDA